ncbi:MAG: PilW family protein [Burkholderiales bacterium]|jgi:type IV pilus assembly protein PilW|nr:PilW family protein [Burkholderiales bacterium]
MKTPIRMPLHKGMTLIETMISSLLGILLIYAVYQAFELSERVKHNTMAAADLRVSGLSAVFLMEREISNAGSGLLPAAPFLAHCQDAPLIGSAFLSLRPLPAVIKKGLNDDANDELFIFYGTAPLHTVPLAITDVSPSPASLTVQTPLGFSENGSFVVVPSAGKNCYAYNTPDASSISVNHITGTTHLFIDSFHEDVHKDDLLIDLGSAIRRVYYVKDNVFYMQEWRLEDHKWKLKTTGDPLIPDVVRFWAQYGIDTDKDNNIDQWVPAIGIWDEDSLRKAPLDQIQQIRALRIAFVIRSGEPDKEIKNDYITSVFPDCPLYTTCSGKTVHIAHDASKPYGWRYRTYEVIIPMRNAIWNFWNG